MRRLLAAIRAQPVLAGEVIYQGSNPGYEQDVREPLALPEPQSFAEARERYEQFQSRGEGDDAGSLITFLYAHCALLEDAVRADASVVYGLWLY